MFCQYICLLCKGWNVFDGQITSMGHFFIWFGIKVVFNQINLGCKDTYSNWKFKSIIHGFLEIFEKVFK
jgi:hypothetical protein